MDLDEARTEIRELAKFGCIWLSPHCKNRMLLRNVTAVDITHVLCWGDIEPGTESDDDKEYIFRMSGADSEGDPLIVVVQLEKGRFIKCLTVWGN
jgi:hypothetical protein